MLVCWPAPKRHKATVLFIPPFAEEMNRCRRLLALTSEMLADRGISSYVLDVPGTGDTPLPFHKASWGLWKKAVIDGFQYLNTNGAPKIYVAGLRLGAVLAVDALVDKAPVIAINPVDGASQIRTLLRAKTIGGQESKQPVRMADLQNALDRGDTVEAAGYALSPELVKCVNAAALADILPRTVKVVDITGTGSPLWLQNEPQPADELAVELATVMLSETLK